MSHQSGPRETKEKLEAFEYYYQLGKTRTLEKVAKKFGKNLSTIKRWSRQFDWQKRIDERDRAIAERAAELKDVEDAVSLVTLQEVNALLIRSAREAVIEGRIRIKSVADWERVVNAWLAIEERQRANEEMEALMGEEQTFDIWQSIQDSLQISGVVPTKDDFERLYKEQFPGGGEDGDGELAGADG